MELKLMPYDEVCYQRLDDMIANLEILSLDADKNRDLIDKILDEILKELKYDDS